MTSITARLGAASVLALAFATAAAAQDPSGYVSGSISNTEVDFGGGDDDVTGYGLGGAYFNSLTQSVNLQLNAGWESLDADPDEVDVLGADAILFLRDSGHALGAFASLADSDDATALGFGGEGQLFRDAWTVGGSAGWFDGDDAYDSLYGACGFGRLYGTDRFAIEGRVALADIDFGGGDSSVFGLGAGAEYQVANSPFSITGDVDRTEFDDADVEATSFRLGGKVHFGTRDLVTRDRDGAGMRGGGCLSGVSRF